MSVFGGCSRKVSASFFSLPAYVLGKSIQSGRRSLASVEVMGQLFEVRKRVEVERMGCGEKLEGRVGMESRPPSPGCAGISICTPAPQFLISASPTFCS
jgi:hypothetical protein